MKDVGELTRLALSEHQDKLDKERVGVYGGSHGGFLTGWLLGHPEYKALFKTGILLNAVLNMSAMVSATDIPEWVFAECMAKGIEWPPSPEQNASFYARSPITVAHNVTVPTLILTGGSDNRVPPIGSPQFYHSLKSRNVPVEFFWYPEDGHALGGDETSLHVLMNMARWFNLYL